MDVDILTTGLLGTLPTQVDSREFDLAVAGDIVSVIALAKVLGLILDVDLESSELTRMLLAALASASSATVDLGTSAAPLRRQLLDVVTLDIDSGCLSRASRVALTSCWMIPERTKASTAFGSLNCLRVRWLASVLQRQVLRSLSSTFEQILVVALQGSWSIG